MYVLFARLLRAGHRRHIALLLGALTTCVVVGGALFSVTQHIPVTTGLYWAITTASTVGYGDVTPKNPSGRIVASVVMFTCIPLLGATFAILTGATVSAGLRKVLNMGRGFPDGSYRIVVGMRPAVPAIIRELDKADEAVVLVADVDPNEIPEDVHLIRGDPTSATVLRRSRLEGAMHALVTGAADGDVLVSSVLIHEQAPRLPISALVRSTAVSEALRELGVNQTISLDDLVAHTMAKSLETPHSGRTAPRAHRLGATSPRRGGGGRRNGREAFQRRQERTGRTSARPCENRWHLARHRRGPSSGRGRQAPHRRAAPDERGSRR